MEAFSAILIPVNNPDDALHALDVAIRLSHPKQASIQLICILDPKRVSLSGIDMLGASADFSVETETKKIQELAAQIARKYQLSCTGICRQGHTVDELIVAAGEFNADLLVMSTHIGSDARAFQTNSDAYNVIKAVPCPVLTVPDYQHGTAFRQILLPIRPVAGALAKYGLARMISQKNDAQLTVLALAVPDEVISIRQLEDELAILKIQLDQDEIRNTMVFYPTDLIAETILEKADELTADLLIITASLATTSTNLFVGSFSQQIIHNARVPVLAVRYNGNNESETSSPFGQYGLDDPGLTAIGF